MLIFTRSLRVCLAVDPVDLRKIFDGLAAERQEREVRTKNGQTDNPYQQGLLSPGKALRPACATRICW
jgi:hypothetical protein